MANSTYDVIVIGGGPGGSTAAFVAARAGLRILLIEKFAFPRFHIGESLLPQTYPLIQELGLESAVRAGPCTDKLGAEFIMGDGLRRRSFLFNEALLPGSPTVNVERATFDKILLDHAFAGGAELRQPAAVTEILSLADGAVSLRCGDDTLTCRYLLDASGQGTLVGRHLGTRRNFAEPELQKVAYLAHHLTDVQRLPGNQEGYPSIVMSTEGWFWIIPLDAVRTSIGFVTSPQFCKQIGIAPENMLAWAVERCPVMRERTARSVLPPANIILSDFSYKCWPVAGPGHFLVGDAGQFLDPIFSTGVTLAMKSGQQAAQLVVAILAGKITPARARRRYIRCVRASTGAFWSLIRGYYRHSFRELFLNGTGPMRVHSAVISVLAGHVFPRPVFAIRWRLKYFWLCVWANQYLPLVPRVKPFSLVDQ